MIPEETYKKIVDSMPIICVDVIVKYKGKYVLIKRKNEPLKGFYWVIGGRLLKNESVWECAMRKIREEIKTNAVSLKLFGIYEDGYSESSFDVPTSTVAIVFEAEIDSDIGGVDSQSDHYILSDTLPQRFEHKLYKI